MCGKDRLVTVATEYFHHTESLPRAYMDVWLLEHFRRKSGRTVEN
jgi:hypothetical protein